MKNITLYQYVHCPFCIRIRMTLGLLDLAYNSKIIQYHDEKTPIELSGVKMLPIVEVDTRIMNESLDIMKFFNEKVKEQSGIDKLGFDSVDSLKFEQCEKFLADVSGPLFKICMPYFIYTKEFSLEAREYFQKKKEAKRGPFSKLVQNQKIYITEQLPILENLEKSLSPFYQSGKLTYLDINIAAHLWGLYLVPEFRFSEKIHHYLQSVKEICGFNYHEDYWS